MVHGKKSNGKFIYFLRRNDVVFLLCDVDMLLISVVNSISPTFKMSKILLYGKSGWIGGQLIELLQGKR